MNRRFNIENKSGDISIGVPREFLYDSKYKPDKEKGTKGLSNDAKLLYGVLLDVIKLNINRYIEEGEVNFVDKNGDIFICFSNQATATILNCSEKTAIKIKKELIDFELIEEVKRGQGLPSKIYINHKSL